MDDPVLVGRRLHAARRRAHLSLRELAFPGCSAAYIVHLEKGRRTPSLQVLVELARRLDVDPAYLAWGHKRKNPTRPDQAASSFAAAVYRRALAEAASYAEACWALTALAQASIANGDWEGASEALHRAAGIAEAQTKVDRISAVSG